ncbi:hypothetical protein EC991_003669 [Linnemannia zychae]|nr:hypothetical protein EC991_003669 [Linnemannia zychae]
MSTTQRIYRLTHTTLTRIHPAPSNQLSTSPHALINLENLSSFAARILLHEHETVPVPSSDTSPKLTSEQVLKKCNIPEWEAKLSGKKPHLNDDRQETGDQEQQQLKKDAPSLPTSRAGVIFVSTTSSRVTPEVGTTNQDNIDRNKKPDTDTATATTTFLNEATIIEGKEEKITSFLFARYEPAFPELQARLKTDLLPPPMPNQFASDIEDPDSLTSIPSRVQKLIEERGGVTRLWLCGTDPAFRRSHLMSKNLQLLEQEVLKWKTKEKDASVSGVVTAHIHPLRFPGMVQFLIKNKFKGGDRIKTSEDKVFYWKEVK